MHFDEYPRKYRWLCFFGVILETLMPKFKRYSEEAGSKIEESEGQLEYLAIPSRVGAVLVGWT